MVVDPATVPFLAADGWLVAATPAAMLGSCPSVREDKPAGSGTDEIDAEVVGGTSHFDLASDR